MIRVLGCFLLLAAVAGLAHGSGCAVGPVSTTTYGPAGHVAYHAPALVAQFVAVPLVVPAYSVGYAAGYDPVSQELAKLRAEVASLRVQAPTNQTDPGANQPPQVLNQKAEPTNPPLPAAVASCVRCHDAGAAKGKGGGLTLFDGGRATMSPAAALDAVTAVAEGRMPRGEKLAHEKVGEVITFFAASARKK